MCLRLRRADGAKCAILGRQTSKGRFRRLHSGAVKPHTSRPNSGAQKQNHTSVAEANTLALRVKHHRSMCVLQNDVNTLTECRPRVELGTAAAEAPPANQTPEEGLDDCCLCPADNPRYRIPRPSEALSEGRRTTAPAYNFLSAVEWKLLSRSVGDDVPCS